MENRGQRSDLDEDDTEYPPHLQALPVESLKAANSFPSVRSTGTTTSWRLYVNSWKRPAQTTGIWASITCY